MNREPLNILLIEKDPQTAQSIAFDLNQIADIECNLKHSREFVSGELDENHDQTQLILLDLSKENGKSAEILDQVTARTPSTPCIVLIKTMT